MGVVQVTLNQVLSGLKQSLHSIDMRAAVKRLDSGWQRVLIGIRISARPLEAVQQRYAELDSKFGKRQITPFKIFFQALPFSDIERVQSELAQGRTTVAGEPLSLEKISFDRLEGRVERHHWFVRPWNEEAVAGVCFSTQGGSPIYQQPEVTAAIRGSLGFSSVEELVDTFLEVNSSGRQHIDFLVYIEMPARIQELQVVGRTVKVRVAAEKNLSPIQLFLSRKDSRGEKLLDHQELSLEPAGEEGIYAFLRGETTLCSASEDDRLSCVLTHDKVPELDGLNGKLKSFMPTSERNPLLECLKLFWDMEKVHQQIERPYEIKAGKVSKGPQDAFQESLAHLLALAGFQAIDLGREDKMRDPQTNVERATLDILAYHKGGQVLLLGACTMNPAMGEDLEKLLHAREIMSRRFSSETPVRLVPVVFSGQENESPFKGQATAQGMKMLNAQELTVLRRLVEKGKEERFLEFLESPSDAELVEKDQWEP